MKTLRNVFFLAALAAGAVAVVAQPAAGAPQQNVLQLSASGTVEVPQDLLSISLVAMRDGTDAATVQGQLKGDLDAALGQVRRDAQPGQMDVRTGNFNLSPRYNRDGKINGWQGSTELVLEGRDFLRVSQAAGRVPAFSVGQVSFGLSREQRAKAETEAQATAIAAFKQKATELAKGFGFGSYTLREVAVHADQNFAQGVRMRVASSKMMSVASDSPVPVEAGKASVTVNVSGSVQLK